MKESNTNEKTKFNTFFFWLKTVLIVGLVLFALVYAALSPLFNIKTVEVTGTVHYNKEMMTDIAGITPGENGFIRMGPNPKSIFTLRFIDAEESIINKCPYVKVVKVKFVIPSTASVEIVERTPMAFVDYMGTCLIVDEDTYVIDTVSTKLRKIELPEIRGLMFTDYILGRRLETENHDLVKTAENIINTISQYDMKDEKKLLDYVDYIDVTDPDATVLYLDSRVTVKIGGINDLNYKISSLKTIYFNNIKENESGLLDFTTGEDPVFSPGGGN